MIVRRALVSALVLGALPAQAAPRATLVYVRDATCPYCRQFDRRIGPIYPRSREATIAPMREIDRADVATSGLRLISPVIYTPTFLLVVDGREIGRIEGFTGEDFFWGQLERLLGRLPRA